MRHKKQELTNKSSTYCKSADPKKTPKEILANPIRYMVQTLPGDLIDVQGDKVHQLTKKFGTDLWLALSSAKNDPKKSHILSLQVHGPTIAKQ